MTDYLIRTDALSLQFGRKRALDSLTLNVARGGIHAIVGANGAGKSSLFHVLLGFTAFTGGTAHICGCDSTRLTTALRGRIGFVNEVSQLSRGERAGVNLAMALAQQPELLILDEPTLGLDVVAKRIFLSAMMQASYDGDTTIVYCSHQMEEIERVADQLIIMERGRLLLQSDPATFCERVSLWVAEFAFRPPDTSSLPGVLECEQIDGLSHFIVFDQDEQFGARLRLLGARSVHSMPVSLDRAINGMLARGHVSTVPNAALAA